jgi:hypothetical protein
MGNKEIVCEVLAVHAINDALKEDVCGDEMFDGPFGGEAFEFGGVRMVNDVGCYSVVAGCAKVMAEFMGKHAAKFSFVVVKLFREYDDWSFHAGCVSIYTMYVV